MEIHPALLLGWSLVAISCLWSAGALYYDAAKGGLMGWILAASWFFLVATLVLVFSSVVTFFCAYAILFAVLLCWWLSQQPSNDREWDPNFSRLPVVTLLQNDLTIENVRHTRYRSLSDYDLAYETRTFAIDELTAIDVAILYWGSKLISHPMVIFEFSNSDRVCFSIEVRYRLNESYNFLRSIYRQNELMYVVSDERDAILRRTKHSNDHEIYLYRLQTDLEHTRQILVEYIDQTNQLVQTPRWYNSLNNNCTTAIYKQRNGQMPWDYRILLNGTMDRMLYDRQILTNDLPFELLKSKSNISDVANSAEYESFGAQVRSGLPGFDAKTDS